MNLIRLGRLTGDPRGEEEAAVLSRAFAGSLQQLPSAHAQWMIALELLAAPSREVVIAGRPGREDTNALLAVLRRVYLPHLTLLLRPEGEEAPAITKIAPFTKEMQSLRRPGRSLRLHRLFLSPPGHRSARVETLGGDSGEGASQG